MSTALKSIAEQAAQAQVAAAPDPDEALYKTAVEAQTAWDKFVETGLGMHRVRAIRLGKKLKDDEYINSLPDELQEAIKDD